MHLVGVINWRYESETQTCTVVFHLRTVLSVERSLGPRREGGGASVVCAPGKKMAISKWGNCSLVLMFVLAAAELPVKPQPASQVKHRGVEIDILSETGGADHFQADELPAEMPITLEAATPVRQQSLQNTRSRAPADILDFSDPNAILDSVEENVDFQDEDPEDRRNLQDENVAFQDENPQASPGPDDEFAAPKCDTCCDEMECGPDDGDAKPECEACSFCVYQRVPCPEKGKAPEGFKAPRLIGAHFPAENPSRAVILTFDADTDMGGLHTGGCNTNGAPGRCPCSVLLSDATVNALQVSPVASPAALTSTPRPQSCLLPNIT